MNTQKALIRQIMLNGGTIVVVALMLLAQRAWAGPAAQGATLGVMSYQGYLTDQDGTPVNVKGDMTFRLYAQPSGGTALWNEDHTEAEAESNAVPVTNGLFNVLLGSLKPIPSKVWDSPDLYLEVQVGNERMTPREQVGRVPYAMAASHALAADSAKQLDAPDGDPAPAVYVDNSGNVGIGTTSPEAGLEIDRGDTNDLALLLESSGLGWGSGIQFKNTAATERIWGIYADQNGALRFADKDQDIDRLSIDPAGNISWTGHLASLTVSGPYDVTLTAQDEMGGRTVPMILYSPDYSVCFLTYTYFVDLDGKEESADCWVTSRDGHWWLDAHLEHPKDATVKCAAMCLQW